MKKVEITNIKGLLAELNSIKLNGKDVKRLTVNRNGYKTLELNTFLDHSIELRLNSENIDDIGEFTVEFDKFYNALKELSSVSKSADIDIDNERIVINADYMSIELDTIEPFDSEIKLYFHDNVINSVTFDIPNVQEFINILEQQKKFTGKIDHIPVISGVDFTVKDNNLQLVSTDGFKLLVSDYPIDTKPLMFDHMNMVISQDTISTLIKILRNNKKEVVKLNFEENVNGNITITFVLKDNKNIILLGKQLNGKYFDYKNVMNDNKITHNFDLNADKLIKSLNIIKKNGINNNHNTSLTIFNKAENSNSLVLTDYGKKIKGKFDNLNDSDNQEILFALNTDFILESLKYNKDNTINIGIENEYAPLLITENKDNFKSRYYLLPVRLDNYELEVA